MIEGNRAGKNSGVKMRQKREGQAEMTLFWFTFLRVGCTSGVAEGCLGERRASMGRRGLLGEGLYLMAFPFSLPPRKQSQISHVFLLPFLPHCKTEPPL